MEMKEYLIDTFNFNNDANKKMLLKFSKLPDNKQCVRFFSHLINSQNKWLARIVEYPNAPKLDWWEPVYEMESLEYEWNGSYQKWISFIKDKTEEHLFEECKFIGYDNGVWVSQIKDVALQLNYHSIHHRAQMQTIIRQQGIEPDFIDYIGTRYKKIS